MNICKASLIAITLALTLSGCSTINESPVEKEQPVTTKTVFVTRWGSDPIWDADIGCMHGTEALIIGTKKEKNGRQTRIYECINSITKESKYSEEAKQRGIANT
ncbi:hypothetical protein LMH73_015630 [Vibrio splendidus]|nr:hypothetical protein [Vibrio splendidus]MCC4883199.1 hypothetical protein [Vibrio splendidus]